MNEIDSLLSQFQTNGEQSTPLMWGETQEENRPPESEDGERLEQSIRDVFSNKQLLNKALATFLGCVYCQCWSELTNNSRDWAIASGTLGSIVLGLFFATLSRKFTMTAESILVKTLWWRLPKLQV